MKKINVAATVFYEYPLEVPGELLKNTADLITYAGEHDPYNFYSFFRDGEMFINSIFDENGNELYSG